MARPRNEEMKESIRRSAWGLFQRIGYAEASYAAIAEGCGIKRNLVQYHFPRKELLAGEFLQRVMDEAQAALGFSSADLTNRFDNIYAVGAAFYGFLLQPQGYQEFLKDIVSSRSLTQDVIPFNGKWIAEHVTDANGLSGSTERNELVFETLVQFGGFYEVLFRCLQTGQPFDAGERLSPIMKAIAKQLGYPLSQIYALTPENSYNPFTMSQAVRQMNASFPASGQEP